MRYEPHQHYVYFLDFYFSYPQLNIQRALGLHCGPIIIRPTSQHIFDCFIINVMASASASQRFVDALLDLGLLIAEELCADKYIIVIEIAKQG